MFIDAPAAASSTAAKAAPAADALPSFQDLAKQYLVEAVQAAKGSVEWLKDQIPDFLSIHSLEDG